MLLEDKYILNQGIYPYLEQLNDSNHMRGGRNQKETKIARDRGSITSSSAEKEQKSPLYPQKLA